MDRDIQQRPVPLRYQQPDRFLSDWVLHDTQEDVDYLLETLPRVVAGLRAMSPLWEEA